MFSPLHFLYIPLPSYFIIWAFPPKSSLPSGFGWSGFPLYPSYAQGFGGDAAAIPNADLHLDPKGLCQFLAQAFGVYKLICQIGSQPFLRFFHSNTFSFRIICNLIHGHLPQPKIFCLRIRKIIAAYTGCRPHGQTFC